MKNITNLLAVVAMSVIAATASAHEITVGSLTISDPFSRATPPSAPVAGGYMTITNNGSEPDRLIGGSALFAGPVEVHTMKMDGGVMKMRRLEDGLEIPAGGEVVLKPGSFHVMFRQLAEQLTEGELRTVTLVFEKAGEVSIEFIVEGLGATAIGEHSHPQ